jgi:hypothetical protein
MLLTCSLKLVLAHSVQLKALCIRERKAKRQDEKIISALCGYFFDWRNGWKKYTEKRELRICANRVYASGAE